MPVTGRKPKPDGQIRHRVKPTYDWTDVLDVPFRHAPKLPKALPSGDLWPEEVKRWWSIISTMPHCSIWSKADWEYARQTALIAAAFYGGDLRVDKDFDRRQKKIGVTADDRRGIRVRYIAENSGEEESDGVTSLDDYRASIAE